MCPPDLPCSNVAHDLPDKSPVVTLLDHEQSCCQGTEGHKFVLNDDSLRFPLALVFAGVFTLLSTLLVAKFNPLIVYSSPYPV